MSELIYLPTVQREAVSAPEPRTRPDRVPAETPRNRPPLWSRVMQDPRGRALRLARRAFPSRYY